ncbi:MAG: DUF192 domain-containing protein [Syntrophomonadaceae bacterium]|nr:DUF192 domain-containing protein [Syntrophomonadaceae bacterium]
MTGHIIIINLDTGFTLADTAVRAASFFKRLHGLLGKKGMLQGEALVLTPCSAVHCIGMRFVIDVVFLDRSGRVVHTIESMKPGSIGPVIKNAYCAIELPEGQIERSKTKLGDTLRIWD